MSDDGPLPAKRSKTNICDENYATIAQQIIASNCEKKLLDMNDYCLNELLSYLDVIDLCSIGRVCKRLKELVMAYFSRKYKTLDFSKLTKGKLVSNQDAKEVLLFAGPMITSVRVERNTFQNHETIGYVEKKLLKHIVLNCKNLHSLKLKDCYFTESTLKILNILSASLKVLSLDGCVMKKYCVLYLQNFISLKNLTVANTRDSSILMGTYPSLRHLNLDKVSLTSQCILQHFIVRHRKLQTLRIESSTSNSSDLFPIIAKYTKNLKNLHFIYSKFDDTERFQDKILSLRKLKKLQVLRLQCRSHSIGKLLTKMVSKKIAIKNLHLLEGLINDETIEAIMQMKDLTDIGFSKMIGLTDEHLIKIVSELPKLEGIFIFAEPNITASGLKEVLRIRNQLKKLCMDKICVDLKVFNEMLDIVKERRNGTVKIFFRNIAKQVFVPQETIRLNKDWILIA